MNRRRFVHSFCLSGVALVAVPRIFGQSRRVAPDLTALAETGGFTLVNRLVAPLVDGVRKGVRLIDTEGEGLAILSGVEFGDGTIDVDLRGVDVFQRSFLGVAFHGADEATFDVISFRPFNFRAPTPAARGQAVQYHSAPRYPWEKLRADKPGKYEHPVVPAPDPGRWFHVRLVVRSSEVQVFVDGAPEPCLEVTLLNNRQSGYVALWAGPNSRGDFADLTIVPA
jgi:hypothetical protein